MKSNGLDIQNNRFMILQGEVEVISMMKPKSGDQDHPGLLEYLEDIMQLTHYNQEIENIQEDFKGIEAERNEKNIRFRQTQKDLDELKEGKDQAMEYIRMEKKLFQCRNLLYKGKIYSMEEEKEGVRRELLGLESENQIFL